MGIPFERFSAIKGKPGLVGCGYSHTAVLKEAKARGYESVLIFEDDVEFLVDKEMLWSTLETVSNELQSFDVIMLAYNIQHSTKHSENLLRVLEASTASAYIVHSGMYDTLIALYEEAMPQLQSSGRHWIYANDQIWKQLQPKTRWYATALRLAKQRASYSDNAEAFVDYGV
jgi:GR25 family glycosyltransferase involved in LPS biosynthesis